MSVKLELYQAVKAKLQTLTFIENVLHYNGQDLNNYQQEKAMRFPQAWIQISNVTWKPSSQQSDNLNRTQQQKSEVVALTIYYASEINLNDDTDTFEDHLTAIDLIYRALTMMETDNINPLQRVSEDDIPNNENVRIWSQTFTTMLTEQAVSKTDINSSPVTLTLNKNILP